LLRSTRICVFWSTVAFVVGPERELVGVRGSADARRQRVLERNRRAPEVRRVDVGEVIGNLFLLAPGTVDCVIQQVDSRAERDAADIIHHISYRPRPAGF